jgi:hypothetical protein
MDSTEKMKCTIQQFKKRRMCKAQAFAHMCELKYGQKSALRGEP